jgi:hypothetical protein
MDDRTIEGLVERVKTLEGQVRRSRRWGAVALIGLLTALAVGAKLNDDAITCKFLTITGPNGEPRIRFWGGNANQVGGRVTMEILDPEGRKACETYWEPNGRSGRFVVYRNDGSGQIFRAIP